MPKEKKKPPCFIIMPISTPPHLVETYDGDPDHFSLVLNELFMPVLTEAGYDAIPPASTGAEVIHSKIITQLSKADLVLCDMSGRNPNVFYEWGIRTALDKPVSVVVDDQTTPIPFDASVVNHHLYSADLNLRNIKETKIALRKHIADSESTSEGKNTMWQTFGVKESAEFTPENTTDTNKLDLLLKKVDQITNSQLSASTSSRRVHDARTGRYVEINTEDSESTEPTIIKLDEHMTESDFNRALEIVTRYAGSSSNISPDFVDRQIIITPKLSPLRRSTVKMGLGTNNINGSLT